METNLEDKQIAKYELLIEVILDHQYSSGIAKKPSRIIITNKTQRLEPLLLLNCYVNVDPNLSSCVLRRKAICLSSRLVSQSLIQIFTYKVWSLFDPSHFLYEEIYIHILFSSRQISHLILTGNSLLSFVAGKLTLLIDVVPRFMLP